MTNKEKLNTVVNLAQKYILLFLKEYLSLERIQNIENLFNNCPIVIDELSTEVNQFGKVTNVGGFSENNKIVINENDLAKCDINKEIELNQLLGTIIHEYAHKIRAINNQYGEMLEESFATIFAEVCINNANLMLNNSQEVFGMLNSINYQKYESQIRAILYVLNQNGMDQKMIAEYIAGDQEKFKQIGIKFFGADFDNYFNSITSRDNKNSEHLLIELMTNYIKNKGLNISDYWRDNTKLTKNNLYFRGSPTLAKAIVNAGSESFKLEEQEFYQNFAYLVKMANENDEFLDKEKVDRVKQYIETNFSLKGKNEEEIYDTIVDLCSTYILHQNRDNEESKIFIDEIKKLVPNIEDFKTKFISLRVLGKDQEILKNIDLDNPSYDAIYHSINILVDNNISR